MSTLTERHARAAQVRAQPEGHPGPRLSGVVLDADTGAPLAGAVVALAHPARRIAPSRPHEVATDATGRFTLARRSRGPALLLARCDGHLPDLALVGVDDDEVTLCLPRGGAVEGTALDDRGASLAGALVTAVSREAMDVAEARTRDDGSFTLAALRPGPYVVTLERDGAARISPGYVDVRAGEVARVSLRGAHPRW